MNFVLESGVFLLMGLQVRALVDGARQDGSLADLWAMVLVAFGLLLVLRVAGVVIRRLRLTARPAKRRDAELKQLMLQLGERTVATVGPMAEVEVDGQKLDPEALEWLRMRFLPLLQGASVDLRRRKPNAWERSLIVQRRYLRAMQEALWEERSIGAYS